MGRRLIIYVAILAAVWAGWLALYLFVLVVDPFELRWAKGERLAERGYPQQVAAHLAPAAARSGADFVIIGASTAVGYTPTMMRRAFPGARAPINLAYNSASGGDLALILPRLERSPDLKLVIISLDSTIGELRPTRNPGFNRRYLSPPWYDPVPEFNLDSAALAFRVTRTGVLDTPSWRPGDEAPWLSSLPARTRGPQGSVAAPVAAARTTVTTGAEASCAAAPALAKAVIPAVRRLAARGVAVDLLAPPYPLAFYFRHAARRGQAYQLSGFAATMAMRRCALQMSAGIPHVRFFSFDTDLPLVGDLMNYADEGHLRGDAPYQMLLRRIAAGEGVVQPGGWPAVEARLKAELAAYGARS